MSRRSYAVCSAILGLAAISSVFSCCSKDDSPTKPSLDNTAPAAVTDLAAVNSTTHGVTLTWTAPGDDGKVGTAARYDVRYSQATITEADWASATQVVGEPKPRAAGNADTFVVTALSEDTTYYFALKAADERDNWSALSNVATGKTGKDNTPPAAVADLAAGNPTAHSVTLTWTAPGDDGNVGTAAGYDIRCYFLPITEANWDSAFRADAEPAPKAAGGSETFVLPGLAANNGYYFALKTIDAKGNVSALSNVTSASTLSCVSCWWPLGAGLSVRGSGGPSALVSALAVYNGLLTAAGGFNTAGDVSADNIAAWNGNSWMPLGSGMDGRVYALAVYDGQLIAGGAFTMAGGVSANYVAAWNGSSWSPLGMGTDWDVYALAVYDGQLAAGGAFTMAGGLSAHYVAAWNGSSWSPLGLGMDSPGVFALTVYGDQLVAGGEFAYAGSVPAEKIAAWDGSAWSPLGSGLGVHVAALTVFNGRLIAGGLFTSAGSLALSHIAAWDGASWSPLGSGIEGTGYNTGVYGLTVFNGNLMAGGWFSGAGGYPAAAIAAWGD